MFKKEWEAAQDDRRKLAAGVGAGFVSLLGFIIRTIAENNKNIFNEQIQTQIEEKEYWKSSLEGKLFKSSSDRGQIRKLTEEIEVLRSRKK